MDLVLVAVGETRDSARGFYNTDHTPLSEKGVYQVERLSDRLYNLIIDRVLVSPMHRARETYSIIEKYHNFHSEVLEDIRDLDRGVIKGLSYIEVMDTYFDQLEKMSDNLSYRLPQGESIEDCVVRIKRVLKNIKDSYGNVLMITDKLYISLVIATMLEDPSLYRKIDIEDGSISVVSMKPKSVIRYINNK